MPFFFGTDDTTVRNTFNDVSRRYTDSHYSDSSHGDNFNGPISNLNVGGRSNSRTTVESGNCSMSRVWNTPYHVIDYQLPYLPDNILQAKLDQLSAQVQAKLAALEINRIAAELAGVQAKLVNVHNE
jgi:hypothetical protein